MEPLNESSWDVVISGTGLHESLLALALSRTGMKILHVDASSYYGGEVAALTLDDALAWVEKANESSQGSGSTRYFGNASIATLSESSGIQGARALGTSRKYSLALAPQLIYAKSALLSSLVSAKVNAHLEFLAMGSWWLCKDGDGDMIKVPNSREDMFADHSIDVRSKRTLIKFLRFVINFEQEENIWRPYADVPFSAFLEQQFGIRHDVQTPLAALSMAMECPSDARTEFCLRRIADYLGSLGYFGPNFGAVVPKYGGLAEVSQVGCRSCAVGGATYVLGETIQNYDLEASVASGPPSIPLTLTTGDKIFAKTVVSSASKDYTSTTPAHTGTPVSRSISIISSPLKKLFPVLADDAPMPAGSVARVSLGSHGPPVTIIIHSSDTGECPTGQSICYAYRLGPLSTQRAVLDEAVTVFLDKADSSANVLWTMTFEQYCSDEIKPAEISMQHDRRIITFPLISSSLVFEKSVLDRVKQAWLIIMGDEVDEADFMKFEPRGAEGEDAET